MRYVNKKKTLLIPKVCKCPFCLCRLYFCPTTKHTHIHHRRIQYPIYFMRPGSSLNTHTKRPHVSYTHAYGTFPCFSHSLTHTHKYIYMPESSKPKLCTPAHCACCSQTNSTTFLFLFFSNATSLEKKISIRTSTR